MRGYYDGNLAGARLRRCYEIASPRVKQYLEAEIHFVLQNLECTDSVLELGCAGSRRRLRRDFWERSITRRRGMVRLSARMGSGRGSYRSKSFVRLARNWAWTQR
jgi:hypothetical protein